MVNWNSPAVTAEDALVFTKFMHVLLGLYTWEWFISLDFDWAFLSGRKKFRWSLTVYFLNRYCMLLALIGIAVALDVTSKVNCQALYTFIQAMGNVAIGLASINLSLRTIAVWSRNWVIVVLIVLVILGHWTLLLHGILLKADWDPSVGCVITSTNSVILSATFIYSMCFDFFVLCLTAYKLYAPSGGGSRLVRLIFTDGLVFFIVAFLANLTAVVFILLDLNPVLSIIANVPASAASTTVACRAVRRLVNFSSSGVQVYRDSSSGSTFVSGSHFGKNFVSQTTPQLTAVHIQMETVQKSDDGLPVTVLDVSDNSKMPGL